MGLKATVPAQSVRYLLSAVENQGCDVMPLLDEVGISKQDIDTKEGLSAYQYGLLYQRIMQRMNDESFGILSGGRMPKGSFRMMCLCILHSKNLAQALRRCSDFYEICRGPTIKPIVVQKGRFAKVTFAPIESIELEKGISLDQAFESRERVRSTLSMWHHFISWLIGRRLVLKAAYFTASRPDDVEYYQTLFQSDIKFSQHGNALVFPASYLDMPLVQNEESLRSFLKTAPYQLLVMVDNDNSLKSRVISILGKDFSQEMLSAEEVAQLLNMSVSTMRRRLTDENTSFQQIKDECRKEAAITYINAPQLSFNEIAALMGFEEPSAFYRSFKKWTGMTPGEYRKHADFKALK